MKKRIKMKMVVIFKQREEGQEENDYKKMERRKKIENSLNR